MCIPPIWPSPLFICWCFVHFIRTFSPCLVGCILLLPRLPNRLAQLEAMDSDPTTLRRPLVACVVGAASGIGAHLGFYIHGEWHVQAPRFFKTYLGALLVEVVGASYYTSQSAIGGMFADLAVATLSHIVGIFASMLVYRLTPGLHRLSRFPGPILLRASKIWHVWACRYSMNHVFLEDLYQKYGEFVRTGPSEITVFHPDVYAATDGPDTTCIKSEWYDLLHPDRALLTTRDRVVHDSRRRDWKQGFIHKGAFLTLAARGSSGTNIRRLL